LLSTIVFYAVVGGYQGVAMWCIGCFAKLYDILIFRYTFPHPLKWVYFIIQHVKILYRMMQDEL